LKLTGWQNQLAFLISSLPVWIENASIGLTIFLAWFGFSQASLIFQGLRLQRGNAPKAPG
jgi:hypothetical protein